MPSSIEKVGSRRRIAASISSIAPCDGMSATFSFDLMYRNHGLNPAVDCSAESERMIDCESGWSDDPLAKP
eukprot:3932627-Prymnesium_polylepis.1